MKKTIILSIETSCDETAIAIVENGKKIHAHIINSQADKFKELGGVVPEMASRMHVDNIFYVYQAALKEANMTIDDIDAIAVTYGPGLVGALLIGVNFANSLVKLTGKPLIAVNHMQGHMSAAGIENDLEYPLLSLVVSGGHTELVYSKEVGHYQILGQTLDDAAGESYDKVARLLKLGYPGGPVIDKLAAKGKPGYQLPLPKDDKSLDFSFSGIKSAAFNIVNQANMKNQEIIPEDFACSFQNRVVEILIKKLKMAQEQVNAKSITIVGGVSANSQLKEEAKKVFPELVVPSMIYSTDNAAMIAMRAYEQYIAGDFVTNTLNAKPNITVEENWQN